MNVENLTSHQYYLPNGYKLGPLLTITVPDAEYNVDDILAAVINSMYAAGSIDVASPPSPFPRGDEHTGESGGSFSGSADDVDYDNTTSGLTADNVQAAIDELSDAGASVQVDDENLVLHMRSM